MRPGVYRTRASAGMAGSRRWLPPEQRCWRGAPGPLPRGGTVTRPFASTMVRPVGSGNDPCRNHSGDPSTAGPRVAGCDCVSTVRLKPNTAATSTTAAPVARVRRFIVGLRQARPSISHRSECCAPMWPPPWLTNWHRRLLRLGLGLVPVHPTIGPYQQPLVRIAVLGEHTRAGTHAEWNIAAIG